MKAQLSTPLVIDAKRLKRRNASREEVRGTEDRLGFAGSGSSESGTERESRRKTVAVWKIIE
jgi:hypothetical protein